MNDQLSTFLQLLWRGAPAAYYWTANGKRTQWIDTFPPTNCILGSHNIYIGVHPCRAKRETHQRARIEDVLCINCLFSEFDSKDFDGELSNIRDHVKGLQFQPQVIVCSGGGYHCYWFIKEPLYLDGINAHEPGEDGYISGTQAAWVRMTGGDPGAKDLARVLRLPGTLNSKYDPPRPVTFSRFSYTGLNSELYDLNDLCHVADDYWGEPVAMRTIEAKPSDRSGTIRGLVEAFASAKNGERNTYLFWVANRLFDNGLSELGVQGELMPTARALGLTERETVNTIRSAGKRERQEPKPPPQQTRRAFAKEPSTLADRRKSMTEAING